MGDLNEGPTWLKAALDQRLAKLEEYMPPGVAGVLGFDVVLIPLTEPEDDADQKKWDETCDNCNKYVPGQLYSGRATFIREGTPVVITFGCCGTCKEAP